MPNPNQSGRPARGSWDSRTRVTAMAIASRQIGTLTKKIQRQEMPLVSTPPRTGPTATATPVVAPNAPNATPRSRPWNAEAISARAVANMAAPPIPWKARESWRKKMSCAAPQAIEPAMNRAAPITKTLRRP